ncbi:MAG: hypothetical protein IJH12_06025 [Clostridia bacterium]|nr:hypothetical protein [Clostridia bacterium]
MKRGIKKRLLIIFLFVAIIMGIVIFMTSTRGIQQEEFSSANYSLKYDTTWKIRSSSENEIILQHNDTQSTIDISITELDSNLYGKSLKQITNNIKSKVEQEYPDYKCISESTTYLSENISEAYQLLFEDGKHQSLIQIGMHGYKIFVSNYTAENKYFDILLDSVQTINSNFKITDKTIEMMNTRQIETTGYTVKTDDVDYGNVEEKTYIGINYKVKYTIPVQFKSNLGGTSYYKDNNDGSSIGSRISISSENNNIFTVYDKEIKNIKDSVYKQDLKVQKITNGNLEGYGIKSTSNTGREYYVLLYALNNFNTLEITVEGEDITENMLDNIKILSYDRCGNYIDRTTIDGYYVGTLNKENYFYNASSSSMSKALLSVSYKVPEKYTEIVEPTYDLGAPESARAFIIGKLRNNEITESDWNTDLFYDYNVTINIAYGSVDTIAHEDNLKYQKDVIVGDITYKYYTSEYDSEGTIIKEAYYLTDIKDNENNKYSFRIYVSSLDDIPESVLQDFASVKIEVKALE